MRDTHVHSPISPSTELTLNESMQVKVIVSLISADPVVSSSRTAATCGGDSVCLVDCETGIVLKKYKVTGEVGKEEPPHCLCAMNISWLCRPRDGSDVLRRAVVTPVYPQSRMLYSRAFWIVQRESVLLKWNLQEESFSSWPFMSRIWVLKSFSRVCLCVFISGWKNFINIGVVGCSVRKDFSFHSHSRALFPFKLWASYYSLKSVSFECLKFHIACSAMCDLSL